jgi:hypothetical protein
MAPQNKFVVLYSNGRATQTISPDHGKVLNARHMNRSESFHFFDSLFRCHGLDVTVKLSARMPTDVDTVKEMTLGGFELMY